MGTKYRRSKMKDKIKRTASIYTLGCKVNQYESEAIAEGLEASGITVLPPSSVCDAYVINTCTVTAESDRKARQFIRRAISKSPSAFIIVTGCLAQSAPEEIASISGVDCIIGNTSKMTVVEKLLALFEAGEKNSLPEICVGEISSAPFEKMSITKFNRTRAYVKIEDGCENKCSYCIIPSARGHVRSKSPSDVISEVEQLTRNGCREVVLTGIETASYGKDLGGVSLADILCRIDTIEGIGRVRLGSLDPSLIKEPFVQRIASLSSLAPHFHLSLQSGSDRILALMKRKYNSEMAIDAIELLRKYIPNVKFTTDVIVGFPGESDEDFRQTAEFVRTAGFLTVHVFPYSKRSGTTAASMTAQIPKDIKTARLHKLESIAAATRSDILEGEVKKRPLRRVLFESFDGEYVYGHTDDFLEIKAKSSVSLNAQLRDVRLERADNGVCIATII